MIDMTVLLLAVLQAMANAASASGPPPAQALSISPLPSPIFWLKQLTVHFPPRTDEATRNAAIQRFGVATRSIDGCAAADKVATEQGAELIENKATPLASMPPQIQQWILVTPVGKATNPFGDQTGMRVLVVCGRK